MWVKLGSADSAKGPLMLAGAGVRLTPVGGRASSFLGRDLYIEKGFLFCVGGFVQEDVRSLMEQCVPRHQGPARWG